MPFKDKLSKISSRFKSNSERDHHVSADEFLHPPLVQTPPIAQMPFNPGLNFSQHPMNNQVPGFVSTSTLSTSRQSVITPPYCPSDVGRQVYMTPDGLQIFSELDASKQPPAEIKRDPDHWKERERQMYDDYYQKHLEKVKRVSSVEAKEREHMREEEKALERKRDASRESIRQVRQLIRERYRLDLYVWNKRNVLKANRRLIMDKCEKSDGILQQIYFIVNAWEQEAFDSKEWEVAKMIQITLSHTDRHAVWKSLPPWERKEGIDPSLR